MTKLIMDLGAHCGNDTELYLAKGARVIAVEANPHLAQMLRDRFPGPIASGRLEVVHAAVAEAAGSATIHVNPRCDHWSSLRADWAGQDGGPTEAHDVEAITLADLHDRFGTPYYLKVDIEGMDRSVALQQASLPLPEFMSVEEWGHGTIETLQAAGFRQFSIRPQSDKSWCVETGAEGPVSGLPFDHTFSGLFGQEVPNWLEFWSAVDIFSRTVRDGRNVLIAPPGEFFDVHARK